MAAEELGPLERRSAIRMVLGRRGQRAWSEDVLGRIAGDEDRVT